MKSPLGTEQVFALIYGNGNGRIRAALNNEILKMIVFKKSWKELDDIWENRNKP